MQKKPLVSIIIPTYNRAHLINETLDSIIAQTYIYWECIVVDDGSTDNSEAVIAAFEEKDKRIQYHKRPKTYLPGGNGARNFGFEESKGKYIQWFDSDDIMHKDKLAIKVSKLQNENTDCCISQTSAFKSNLGDDLLGLMIFLKIMY